MPSAVGIKVLPEGDIIDSATGGLVGSWLTTDAVGVVGSSTAGYPAPAGCILQWTTGTILDANRIVGRTFVVPLGGNAYQADGTLSDTTVAAFTASASAYVASAVGNALVWHRPRKARAADGSRPAVTARAGGVGLITGGRCVDKAVVLRSRRD